MLEPCAQGLFYTEGVNMFGVKYIRQDCDCGAELGSHSLKGYTLEDIIKNLSELVLCHRKGVGYDEYMGFLDGGEEMTEEEYAVVRERLK